MSTPAKAAPAAPAAAPASHGGGRGRDIAAPSNPAAPTAENIGLSELTTMLISNKKSSPPANGETAGQPSTEQPAGRGQRAAARTRTSPAPAASETAAPALGAPAENTESDAPAETTDETRLEETRAATETTDENAPEGDAAETTEEAAPEPGALHPELQAAIDEAKAGGQKGMAKILARLHRLVDERDTHRHGRLQLQEALQQAQTTIQQLRKNPDAGTAESAGDRYAAHPAIAPLTARITQAEGVLQWCDDNADGATLHEGTERERTFSPQEIKAIRNKADRDLIHLEAERSTQLNQLKGVDHANRAKFNTEARRLYPWLNKPDSPQYTQATALVNALPILKTLPGLELIVGRYIAGLEAETARQTSAATRPNPPRARPAAAPTQLTGRPAAAAPRANPADAVTKAEAKFKQGGSVKDLAELFATKAASRRAA